jgi:hypothetical protein
MVKLLQKLLELIWHLILEQALRKNCTILF